MTNLTITALYASLLAIIFIALSVNIIRLRFKHKVGIGDGGESTLRKAVRVHGNLPLALILLGCYEIGGAEPNWVHILGGGIVLGRVLHALGLSKSAGTTMPRFIGTMSTFIVLLTLAIVNINAFLLVGNP